MKSKGRPVQGQILSQYCKIHLRGVVKVSVFIKATLFGCTYRYARAMFRFAVAIRTAPVRRLVIVIVIAFIGFFCDC